MPDNLNYLEKMKRGIAARSIVSSAFILIVVAVYLKFNSIINIPAVLKIILAISGISAMAINFYVIYFLLVCPFCHKSFESSVKHRLFGTKVIPHRCPNCGVVIDYTK